MKALTLTAYNQFELLETPRPEISDDDVLVRIQACGICGSDIHGADGSSGRRIPPIVMGHEASGEIAAVGAKVTDWKVGQRVAFDSMLFCGECDSCQDGRTNLCPERRVIGVSCDDYRQDGAFAEFVCLPARCLFAIPESMSYEEAAFGEPVAVALHAVRQVNITGGETVLVIGAGLIGLLVLQALKAAGAARVFVTDLDKARLELGKKLGADDAWTPDTTHQDIMDATDGKGADVVMEVVGIEPTIQQAIQCVRNGGAVGCVGNLAPQVQLPLQQIVTREITLFGSCASSGEYADALAAVADGSIQVQPLISAVAGLSEGSVWFERLQRNDEGLLKVILKP